LSAIQKFIENKSRISVQFVKYVMAGATGTAVHFAIFALLNETVLPADISLKDSQRGWNFFWSFSIAFLLANMVGYALNRRWVFQPGRHGRLLEIGLFYTLATFAFVIGTPFGAYVLGKFPLNEYFVYVLVTITSVFVNFLGRKFLVFKH